MILPDANKLQYFRAMVSEEERLDIAEACYEEGFDEGKAQGKAEGLSEGLEQMVNAMRKDGMYEEDIQRILSRAKEA